MKPGGGGPPAAPDSEPAGVPLVLPPPWGCPADVRLCGHLRKQKSQRRRFFVLRADPPRLECYESEKKFRAGRAPPKLSVSLAGACTISKRVDARQRHLIVLYTRDRSLGVAAACEAEQQAWYSALLEARAAAGEARAPGGRSRSRGGGRGGAGAGAWVIASLVYRPSFHEDPGACILAPLQDVWPVTLRPKGLGRTRGLGSGGYRLCLGSGVLSLLRKPKGTGSGDTQASPPPPALRLPLLSVRRCGHADSFFFLELGRSAPTGPGELWLQAPDAEVAQSIHETVLAAMKRLGDGGAGGRAEPPPRNAPASAYRPSASQPYAALASAAQSSGQSHCRGLAERRGKAALRKRAAAASPPEGLERGGGYVAMGARSEYEPMGGGEAGGYMVMAPPRLAASAPAAPHYPRQGCGGTEYVPMSRFPPGSLSSSSLPCFYKLGAGEPGPSFQGPRRSIGERWGPAGAHSSLQPPSELAGEYVCIKYVAPDYLGMGTAIQEPPNGHLNYVDLDLIPPLEARGHAPGASRSRQHSYACIEFQNLREAPVRRCAQPRPV
ncbi:hypothetical protein GH733_017984 [Mirounga leonina]|nr:hypothetical protein GH733_017984 [Mirounga leonina]